MKKQLKERLCPSFAHSNIGVIDVIPLEILIPAVVSLIVGLGAHSVSLMINKNNNKSKSDAMKNIRGVDSLETQIEHLIDENKELGTRLLSRENREDESREVRYSLELKLALLEREITALKKTVKTLNEENFQLKTEISMLRSLNNDNN